MKKIEEAGLKFLDSWEMLYAIRRADVKISGTKTNGKWRITVELKDRFDFTEFSLTLNEGVSLANVSNDLGWVMQQTKMLFPYNFAVKYTYVY